MTRIERKQIDALVDANRDSLATPPVEGQAGVKNISSSNAPTTATTARKGQAAHSEQRHAEKQQHTAQAAETVSPQISIDDFVKVDLR
ncbi:MAG: hypothetical protein ABR561_08735, partial [Guyparkeria sp.]